MTAIQKQWGWERDPETSLCCVNGVQACWLRLDINREMKRNDRGPGHSSGNGRFYTDRMQKRGEGRRKEEKWQRWVGQEHPIGSLPALPAINYNIQEQALSARQQRDTTGISETRHDTNHCSRPLSLRLYTESPDILVMLPFPLDVSVEWLRGETRHVRLVFRSVLRSFTVSSLSAATPSAGPLQIIHRLPNLINEANF
ncbi:hypothetical protein SKAU_G00352140 [Synaphobranchus kaupii]|uniref:Uncharacterized protein n=1 Tax=Synaphobranchus kaupii TaxID=118154 RepID=A0A9Q1EKP6_SYNKA|nr:hypothetical protein SKAU_G00352140 [Synaphobranchus kaupii]